MPSNAVRMSQKAATDLAQRGERAAQLRAQLAAKLDTIRSDERLSEQYKAQLIEQARAEYTDNAARLRSLLDSDRETMLTAAAELDRPGDVNAQLLAETRQQRAWDRARPMLDNGRTWRSVLAEAEKAGDTDTVQALAAELPAYFEAGRSITGGMQGNADQALDQDNATRILRGAVARTLGNDNGPGTAARLRLQAEAHAPVVEAQLDRLDREISGQRAGIGDAIATHYAEQNRDATLGELDTTPTGDSSTGPRTGNLNTAIANQYAT
ncbi:hypothetical protein DFQ14_12219 [Halopolyspora algeriensis]|uniref:Uncharacterized protein n=1 Tax=Halopolyspora algeriensis TaxID=1500506 RepID=A0A368VBI3_9ACTN|nr:hypothetical protein [Halopolyspora algeriensis]RCW38476.1 hypothetical protein DFQ14_12219 [Halopolyspora algeriensis]TQM42643.1 hypothetical protein FHU43_4282 [Halopolyspora algeriensis]